MSVKMIVLTAILILLAIPAMATQIGCGVNNDGKWDYGSPVDINIDYEEVVIADILNNSKEFEGETVVVEGAITLVCPTAGCWLYIEDNGNSLFIQFYDFTVNMSNKTRIRIIGEIRLKDGQPYLVAKGLKVL